jgi:MFS superfamily sulfate permease-like transporter/CRP-like cAMP-binding protein
MPPTTSAPTPAGQSGNTEKKPGRRARQASLLGELRGGVTAAVVSLGILLPLGLLSFAALGMEGVGIGVRAAFATAIFGGLVTIVVGGARIPGSNPKTSTSLIFAGFVVSLVADPQLYGAGGNGLGTLLLLTSLCVGLAGLLQVGYGLLRLGSLVKFVPLPVVAGFMDGVAILIAVSQARPLLGLPGTRWSMDLGDTLHHVQGGALAIGLGTVALAWFVARRWPRAPWALVGLVGGAAAHFVARQVFPEAGLGPLLGASAAGLPQPTALLPLVDGLPAVALDHVPQLLTTAVVISIIGSLDGLLSAVAVDTAMNTRHDANRMLLGQGLGNLASAVFGGVPVVYSTAVPIATHRAGGNGSGTGWVSVVLLLLILVLGGGALALIPVPVSAGVMLVVALGLFDQWSRVVWRQLRTGSRDRDALWSLTVVITVGAITILFGFVASIAVGVLLSMALFIVTMNRSLVRSTATGATRASRRVYYPDQASLLREHGHRIKVLELEGAVFFGTAEKLSRQVEALATDARFVILDLRRVTTIDASGAMALEGLARRLASTGVALLLAGIVAGDRHAKALRGAGAFLAETDHQWFADADHALEFAERQLLDEAGARPPEAELPLDGLPLMQGLDAAQQAVLASVLERVALSAGEVLFRAGEPGDRVYVLAQGSISILSGTPEDRKSVRRLASFTPGVIFGETAMLDGGGRTATARADQPSVAYVLTRERLDEIRRTNPALASQVLLNLARQLSARLRNAAATIESADY